VAWIEILEPGVSRGVVLAGDLVADTVAAGVADKLADEVGAG
jgi:hypothetical protein